MIYLDHNATTPLAPEVLKAMIPFLTENFGNAASRHHALGCAAATAVETARQQVASVIRADPREIVWTSGATESNNLALLGVTHSAAYRKQHIITVSTEHRAVLDTCDYLEKKGFRVTYLGVDSGGRLDLAHLKAAITDQTLMVSAMHANNETGVLHPISKIGALCREHGILFHTDATQSYGKEPIDVSSMHIDLLSASAHKIHGPKGVGILYVRRRDPRVRCEALIHGGGHERGLRSGTLNVPGIVGMGIAATLPKVAGIRRLRDHLEKSLCTKLHAKVNGHHSDRLNTTSNLSFNGVDGAKLMARMPGLAVSSSSACTSALLQPSYVLGAMGCDDASIRGSVRFSLGRFTSTEEIDTAVTLVVESVEAMLKS
ncbi:MAG: IscS subfamily cysteine desulfurase [Acidobacteria bacterium]|nr:IscS subfamily cysteine desulfurase [Acidobacteriota bacterium]|tara:strand:- start:12934 stop:14055 length:1122 start_codon:yes stop_codon:yes gene_type:complete